MKILFLSTVLPLRPDSGGEFVSHLIINELLREGHEVKVLGYVRMGEQASPQDYMVPVKSIPIESKTSKTFTIKTIVKSFFTKRGYSSEKYVSREYIEKVNEYLKEGDVIVILDHFQLGWVLEYIPKKIKIISIAHNVESELYRNISANEGTGFFPKVLYAREAGIMKLLEEEILKRSDQVWVITEENKRAYLQLFPSIRPDKLRYICIPPSEEALPMEGCLSVCNIGMIGTWSWDANRKGLKWFFDEVYPLIPQNITIHVAGKGGDWLEGKFQNVTYRGYVESADDFVNNSQIIAIPSTAGEGIQIKTIHTLSLGRPVVATTFALRGIAPVPSYVYIGDDRETFAEALLKLVREKVNPEIVQEAKDWNRKRRSYFRDSLTSSLKEINGNL